MKQLSFQAIALANEFDADQTRGKAGKFSADTSDAIAAAHEASRDAHKSGEPEDHLRAAKLHRKVSDKLKSQSRHPMAAVHEGIASGHEEMARAALANAHFALPDGEGYQMAVENASSSIDDDGWALIAPYGEHPKTRLIRQNGQVKEQRFIQVLDHEAADQLMSSENSIFRRIRRAVVGIPVYKGHPDLSDHAPETLANGNQRKAVVGVIDQVRKGDRGIEAHFSLAPEGAAAVENEGCKYPSALWLVMPNGTRDGAILCRPFKLLSAGLTPYPNISGVDSLANAKSNTPAATETDTTEHAMKNVLLGWLAAKGVTLANDATDQQVLKAIQDLASEQATAVTTLGNEKTSLSGKITTLENERNAEKKRADEAAAALANEQTARQAERKGRADAIVDLAIHRGKLTIAQREEKAAALANAKDFEADAKALLAAATKTKTIGSENVESGKVLGNTEEPDARSQYGDALKEEMKTNPDPVKAHAAVMARHPGLAEKLKGRGKTA